MIGNIGLNKWFELSGDEMMIVTSILEIDNGSRIVHYKVAKNGEIVHFVYLEETDEVLLNEWWILLPDVLLEKSLYDKKTYIDCYKTETSRIVKEYFLDKSE